MATLPDAPSPTRDAIFAAYEADRDDGFRPHLGASQIGKPCERALWYDFRWVTRSGFQGRILRLFETGQLEEARLVRNLRRIGATVLEVDPETGRQWRVEAHGGHFGGSLDAVALGLIERRRPGTSSSSRRTRQRVFGNSSRRALLGRSRSTGRRCRSTCT